MHSINSFNDLSLSQETLKALNDMGFSKPFPIQAEAIPVITEGSDVVGLAQTGTGKSAAFIIPAIEKINSATKNTQVLVLCPTRELAVQVAEEAKKLLAYRKDIRTLAIYGGDSITRQIQDLRRGVHFVVGTPGRILDHLNRKTLAIDALKMIILDEADEMLNMGFREDIERVLQSTPETRQTVLFSATMSSEILRLTKQYQKNQKMIRVSASENQIQSLVEQVYVEIEPRMKLDGLIRLIEINAPKLSIVFCNTKRRVDDVVQGLRARGYAADGIHGDINQVKRNRVMGNFRNGSVSILVATDVAARGIDVSNVEAVFNYELPFDEESYVHRIGRTGRAGRTGKSFSFISSRREFYQIKAIQRYAKSVINRQELPSRNAIEEARTNKFLTGLRVILSAKNLERYRTIVSTLEKENFSTVDIAAALLKLSMGRNETIACE